MLLTNTKCFDKRLEPGTTDYSYCSEKDVTYPEQKVQVRKLMKSLQQDFENQK
jgi:hypothetical protein